MEQLVETIIKIDYDDLSTFDFPINEKFGLSVNFKNVEYEFLVHLKSNSDKIICLGSGNKSDDDSYDNSRPYFHRNNWEFNESTIWYNDPTRYLSDDLPGAWGVGKDDDYYLKNIGDIIVKLAKRLNLNEKNLFFYGSSMGGFTSIQLATMFKNSTAIADIPQFFFQNHIRFEHVIKYAFPGKTKEEVLKKYRHRFDVLNMMVKEYYIPKAILILNCSNRDINTQYVYFINGINQLPHISNNKNSIKIVLNNTKNHEPLNKSDSIELVNEITSHNLMNYIGEIENSELFLDNIKLKKENEELIKILTKWGYNASKIINYEELLLKEQHHNKELKNEINKKNRQIEELTVQLEQKQNEYNELLHSNSWKVTKPLRNISKSIKK